MALTERQRDVLRVMAEDGEAMTCNRIAISIGFDTGSDHYAHDGRMMGPANRVIGSIMSLARQGLVHYGRRPDGKSGTAYRITEAGREALQGGDAG